MRVYLAGPIRNIPAFNAPAFDEAAMQLRAAGHEVFSPVDHDRAQHGEIHALSASGDLLEIAETTFNLRAALRDDLVWIADHADAVAVLPGWENSRGARCEVALAEALDLPVHPFAHLCEVLPI